MSARPTIYAGQMNKILEPQLRNLRALVEGMLLLLLENLKEQLANEIRVAYVAGVRDGFQQRIVREGEE